MRLLLPNSHRVCKLERGSAVVMFLALLAIMLVLVAANGKTLVLLKQEIRLIEQRQIQRLERSQADAAKVNAPVEQLRASTP